MEISEREIMIYQYNIINYLEFQILSCLIFASNIVEISFKKSLSLIYFHKISKFLNENGGIFKN